MTTDVLTVEHSLTFTGGDLGNVDLTTSFGLQISFNARATKPMLIDMASAERFSIEDCSDQLALACSRYMDALDAIVTGLALEKALLLFTKRVEHRRVKYGVLTDRDLSNICHRFHRRRL